MLDANKIEDLKKMTKYGKANGQMLVRMYNLPTFSHYFIIENSDDIRQILVKYPKQENFCMRSDTLIREKPIGIGGKNGNRETIFQYLEEIKRKSNYGVSNIYWQEGNFCPTYKIEGSYYLNFVNNERLIIEYVGRGWDGSYLSHGTAVHETYIIPWNEILFLNNKNKKEYLVKQITQTKYEKQREQRIKDLTVQFKFSKTYFEQIIPKEYSKCKNKYFQELLDKIVVPMYSLKIYKEYIVIVQIENGRIICPEIILPSRLKY